MAKTEKEVYLDESIKLLSEIENSKRLRQIYTIIRRMHLHEAKEKETVS